MVPQITHVTKNSFLVYLIGIHRNMPRSFLNLSMKVDIELTFTLRKKSSEGPFSCPQNRPRCGTIFAPLCDVEPFHEKEICKWCLLYARRHRFFS